MQIPKDQIISLIESRLGGDAGEPFRSSWRWQ
jgi:hypothetical protein